MLRVLSIPGSYLGQGTTTTTNSCSTILYFDWKSARILEIESHNLAISLHNGNATSFLFACWMYWFRKPAANVYPGCFISLSLKIHCLYFKTPRSFTLKFPPPSSWQPTLHNSTDSSLAMRYSHSTKLIRSGGQLTVGFCEFLHLAENNLTGAIINTELR
jgi:hypothetical protein